MHAIIEKNVEQEIMKKLSLKKIAELGGLSGNASVHHPNMTDADESDDAKKLRNILSKNENKKMKTLKQIVKEAKLNEDDASNWTMSAADLAKGVQDPALKQKLTTHNKTSADQLVTRISQWLTPESLVGMSQAEISSFEKKINQLIDTALWKAKQSADKVAQEPATNAGAMKRTDTKVLNTK